MFDYYLGVLKKYAIFAGRTRRAEYWYFVLVNTLIIIALIIINTITGNKVAFLSILYFLAVSIPSLSVVVRRLHDTGRSGWWILISLIPLIGFIWLLILLIIDGNPKENKYGLNPKGPTLKEETTI